MDGGQAAAVQGARGVSRAGLGRLPFLLLHSRKAPFSRGTRSWGQGGGSRGTFTCTQVLIPLQELALQAFSVPGPVLSFCRSTAGADRRRTERSITPGSSS